MLIPGKCYLFHKKSLNVLFTIFIGNLKKTKQIHWIHPCLPCIWCCVKYKMCKQTPFIRWYVKLCRTPLLPVSCTAPLFTLYVVVCYVKHPCLPLYLVVPPACCGMSRLLGNSLLCVILTEGSRSLCYKLLRRSLLSINV